MDEEPTRPRSLTFPVAVVISGLTVLSTLAGSALALEFNQGLLVSFGLLTGWWIGHFTAAWLALFGREDYGAVATWWVVGSLILMGAPVVLAAAGLVWLSQQQLWTII